MTGRVLEIERSTTVIIQNRDGSIAQQPGHRQLTTRKRLDYYAAVPAQLLNEQSTLIDRIIGFAFDTLSVRRLEVRVVAGPDQGFRAPTGQAQLSKCQPLCAG
jgi:hypothetical protein